MMAKIECFGEPRITINGDRLPFGGKQPVLLATLVASGPDGLSKDQLFDELYRDAANVPSSGSQSALMLAQRLGNKVNPLAEAAVVVSRGPRLHIDRAHCSVDVWDFESALAGDVEDWIPMLAKWEEPYAGLHKAPQRVQLAAEELRRIYRVALARAAWLVDPTQWTDVLDRILREVDADPFNESLVAGAAVALYRAGRQTEALKSLSHYRASLLDAHGLDAGHKVNQVEQAILNHDLLMPARPESNTPVSHHSAPYEQPERFIGQQHAADRLQAALHALGDLDEAGGIHLVLGEGGSGKSTLLAHLLTEPQVAGLRVVSGSARIDGGLDDSSTYRPFLHAFPELRSWTEANESMLESEEQVRLQFWSEVQSTIARTADEGPLVLVLEDIHEADSPTISLIRNLVNVKHSPNLLLLITSRSADAESQWGELLGVLSAREDVRVHQVVPFEAEEVQTIVSMDHPSEPLVARERFARAVLAASHGNALVATVLSRDAVGGLELLLSPESVSSEQAYFEHIARRIEDRDLERVLLVASMIGLEFDSQQVSEVVEFDPAIVEAKLEEAARLRLCERLGLRRWRFDHLLTAAALSTAAGFFRPLMFAKLARAGTDNPLRMLRYVRGAEDNLDLRFAIEQLQWAADLLERQGAFEESALAWTELLERRPDPSVDRLHALVGAIGSLSRIGRREDAKELRIQAVALARQLDDVTGVYRAAVAGLPSAEYVGGEEDRLDALLEMTEAELAAVSRVEHAKWCLRFARVCERPETALSIIDQIDDDWPASFEQRADLDAEVLVFRASQHRPQSSLWRLRELGEACPDGPQRAEILHRTSLACLTEQRPRSEIIEAVGRAAAASASHGSPRTKWSVDVLDATLARVGITSTEASAATARSSGHRWGINDVEDNFMVQSFMELWLDGQVGLAQLFIEGMQDQLAMNIAWEAGLALSSAVNGDDQAEARTAKVCKRLIDEPGGTWSDIAAALLAETAVLLKDAEAGDVVTEVLQHWSGLAIVLGTGSAHFGPVDRYLAIAALAKGDPYGAKSFLLAATAQAEATGTRYWADTVQRNLQLLPASTRL